jgi:hypothetical protein
MNERVEQNAKGENYNYIPAQAQNAKKYKIVCKFWMMGNCIKDEKCDYLHTGEHDQKFQNKFRPSTLSIECPMYKFGFCKNGPLCKFQHTKSSQAELENIPLPENDIPIWYLEYFFEKPINLIFEEFEKENPEIVSELKEKHLPIISLKNKHKPSIPRGNININFLQLGGNTAPYQQNFDIYAEKKDSILEKLEQKVRYFLIRCKNMDGVKYSMENNLVTISKQTCIKFKEAKKSCDNVIFIIFDEENLNYCGFVIFRKELTDDEIYLHNKNLPNSNENSNNMMHLKVEWLWRTKLSYTKLDIFKNPLADNELFINSKDGQEISIDLGHYVCRMMIKRLTREEVRDYMENKRIIQNNEKNMNVFHNNNFHYDNNFNYYNYNNNYNNNYDNSIIYEQGGIKNSTQINSNTQTNFYVTNISNLQVNLDDVRNYEDKGRYKNVKMGKKLKYDNEHKRREKNKKVDHKKTRERKRENEKNRHRDGNYKSRSKNSLRSKNSKTSSKNSTSKKSRTNSFEYDSDETVVLKEEKAIQPCNSKEEKLLGRKRDFIEDLKDKKIETPQNSESVELKNVKHNKAVGLMPDNKVFKNKLFSNAMEKIALNYLKNDSLGKSSHNTKKI